MVQFLLTTFTVLIPLAVIILGLIPVKAKDARRATIWEVGIRAVMMLLFAFLFFFAVPHFIRIFGDFGVELPGITIRFIAVTDLRQPVSWLALSFAELLLASDIVLFAVLRHNNDTIQIAKWISIVSTALFTLTFLIVLVSLALPLIKLLNDLS